MEPSEYVVEVEGGDADCEPVLALKQSALSLSDRKASIPQDLIG